MGLTNLNNIGLIVICAILLLSCNLFKDDDLSLKRENYNGTLYLNGYYYNAGIEGNTTRLMFFSNGVVLNAGTSNNSLNDFEASLRKTEKIEKLKRMKFMWGIYQIKENNIILERFTPGPPRNTTFLSYGKILNDSTFIINRIGEEKMKYSLVYHFREFSPKPDSIVSFID